MRTAAIEINDAGLAVARGSQLLAVEPGYALFTKEGIVVGEQAKAQARLTPRRVSNRYWANLSLAPGSSGLEGVESAAELAFVQLQSLWKRLQDETDDVILAVPGDYTREQLGLLLGLAEECGMPVRGMVDAAAAASVRPHPGRQLLYLDAGLHRVLLTSLEQGDHVASRRNQELADVGLAGVTDLWAKRLAELFVLSTRFDPLHQAQSEQALYDRLPAWLKAIETDGAGTLEMEHADERFEIQIERDQLLGVSSGFYRALVQLVSQSREPGASLTLQVSDRLAELPGVIKELGRMDDAHVVPLPAGAAVLGALASLPAFPDGAEVRLLKHLPWREAAETGERPVEVQPAQPEPSASVRATHVVYRGIAHAVDGTGLIVGRGPFDGRRGILLDGGHSAVSRSHCEITLRHGALMLVDLSRYGTFVNEKRVAKETVLHPGDLIRVGLPGEELRVIALEDSHGARA